MNLERGINLERNPSEYIYIIFVIDLVKKSSKLNLSPRFVNSNEYLIDIYNYVFFSLYLRLLFRYELKTFLLYF